MDMQQKEIKKALMSWDRKRRLAVVEIICHIVYFIMCRRLHHGHVILPSKEEHIKRQTIRDELVYQLKTRPRCRDIIRMGPQAFLKFCDLLRKKGGLQPTRRATVEEQVGIFLWILGHTTKNREIQFFFRRSGETVSRHFHNVLRSVLALEDQFLRQPNGSEVPPEILNSSRFYPYFKDYIGALDGTHVRVKVSTEDAPRYRGRKDYPTQNVLAACSFDLRFTYVLPGWEGTASDSRIIKNALSREDKLIIPQGKYYLVDAGYMLRSGLLAPYRGVRYHLKEFSSRAPANPQELFNLRHASLRNAIERAFGVLKKRFPIIASTMQPNYCVETQTEIILACCIIHNYLMGVDPDEDLIAEVDNEIQRESPEQVNWAPRSDDEDASQALYHRNTLAVAMWNDYESSRL